MSQTLVDTGHHVRAKIVGVKCGDPLILRNDRGEPRYVVYALCDQVDDSRIPTSDQRTGHGNLVTFWVWPRSGKVQDMALWSERATEADAAAAVGELARKGAK